MPHNASVAEVFLGVILFFLRYTKFMRLDLFLKTSRLVKRRTIAREMCEAGRVLVNRHQPKPSKELKQGDFVALQFTNKGIELEILALFDGEKAQKFDATPLYRIVTASHVDTKAWTRSPS